WNDQECARVGHSLGTTFATNINGGGRLACGPVPPRHKVSDSDTGRPRSRCHSDRGDHRPLRRVVLGMLETIRTARSRTSGENRLGLATTPSSQGMEPPGNPGRSKVLEL